MIESKTNTALGFLVGVVAAMLFHIGTASLSNRSKVTVQAPSAVPMLTARPATPTERTQGTATDDDPALRPGIEDRTTGFKGYEGLAFPIRYRHRIPDGGCYPGAQT